MKPGALLALIGGVAASLGHAPFHMWFLAFPGLVAVVWSVSRAETRRAAFWRGWLGGAAYFAITLHWIVEPFLVDAATHGWMAPFALMLMAGGLALFWGGAAHFALGLGVGPGRTAIAFAFTLTAAEMLRGVIFTGFPWAMPAYIWAETPLRVVTAWTGSYGLTLVTLLAAACPALSLRFRAGWLMAAVALGALYLVGDARIVYTSDVGRYDGKVGFVGSNIPQNEKWDAEKVPGQLGSFMSYTREVVEIGAPDLIIWPEVSIVYPLDRAANILAQAAEAAGDAHLMTGINRRDGDNWFNSMVLLGPDGTLEEVYDKVHLVPFGEYIPFKLGFLRAMAAASSNGFSSGDRVRLIETPLGRALPLICYEGIFPHHIFAADARPDFLILISNDAWFGTFAGPQQHFDQARFRAAEQGLSIVRSANKGISGVIDAYGKFYDSKVLDRWHASTGVLWRLNRPTLYSRTGDSPLLFLLVVAFAALMVLKRRASIAKPPASS